MYPPEILALPNSLADVKYLISLIKNGKAA
jgi:hypothetical protein